MCERWASITVDRDGVEGACGGHEVLPVGLLTRPRSDRGRSCERVTELEYADESSDHTSYFEAYAEPSVPEQAMPERPTNVLIVVPTPPIDATFPCCPGCEVLNELVTKLVPIEEEHPVAVPRDNQGRGVRMAVVRSGQRARHGGRSDRRGYRGVARMQPSTVPRREYPDRCKWEQSRLGRFAKLGLAGEETGDDELGSDSSHAEEFRFGVGFKRDGRHIRNGGCILSPLASGESGGMSG